MKSKFLNLTIAILTLCSCFKDRLGEAQWNVAKGDRPQSPPSYIGTFVGTGSMSHSTNMLYVTASQIVWTQEDGATMGQCILYPRSVLPNDSFTIRNPHWQCNDAGPSTSNVLMYDSANNGWLMMDGTAPYTEYIPFRRVQ